MTAGSHQRRTARVVSILDQMPSLADGLTPDDLQRARALLRGSEIALPRGEQRPGLAGTGEATALLVLDGWLIRTISMAGRRCGLLAGPGTVARPWDDHEWFQTIPFEVAWRALEPARVAVLDDGLVAAMSRWPALVRALFRAGSERSHTLLMVGAIQSLQHVELRLRMLMWMYADRYGRVTPEGVVLPVRLNHRDLAELIGSQRPSVSAHLAELSARGEIIRRPDRTWLLTGRPPGDEDDARTRTRPPAPGR